MSLLVAGGVTDQFGPDYLRATLKFSFKTNEWSKGPSLNHGRYHHACARIKVS
jgi:hypothetical protein